MAILIRSGDRRRHRPRNGLITLRFGIPSFITTLGMLFIVRTAAPFIVGYIGVNRSINFKPPAMFRTILVGNIGTDPGAVHLVHRCSPSSPTSSSTAISSAITSSPPEATPMRRASPASTSSGPSSSPSCCRSVFAAISGTVQHHAAADRDDQSAALHRALRGGDLRDRRPVAVRRARLGDRHRARRGGISACPGRHSPGPPAGLLSRHVRRHHDRASASSSTRWSAASTERRRGRERRPWKPWSSSRWRRRRARPTAPSAVRGARHLEILWPRQRADGRRLSRSGETKSSACSATTAPANRR